MNETGPNAPPGNPETGAPGGAADGDVLDEAGYATLLEEAFIAERGTPFLLSSKDWLLIRDWRESGIPADSAIRAIHETFEKRRARGQVGKIGSLSYCENAVVERWEMERRGLVGQGSGARDVAPESVTDRLKRLVVALQAARERSVEGIDEVDYRKAILAALQKIESLPPSLFEETESALSAIETSLSKKLEKALHPEPRAALEARAEAALGAPGAVSPEIRERTRRALVKREVRRLLQIPPLTLFDL